MGGQGNNGATSYANHNGIVGMTFQGYNFANTDSAHHHMECIHDTPGSDHITLAASRLLGCPVESFYAEGTTQTNILVENNYFDGSSNMEFGCDSNGCVMSNITIRFNSFHGAGWFPEIVCTGTNCATINSNLAYGNIGAVCPTWSVPYGGTYAGSGFTTSYNVSTGSRVGVCTGDSTSVYNATVTFASPGSPSYDLDLSGVTQSADGLVPGTVSHPPTDVHGNSRPAGANDAGADEH